MTSPRLLLVLTGLNLVLLVSILASRIPPLAADTHASPMLRGRGLEIVDERGQVRASIEILPRDSTVKMPDGTTGYPETVLFRLRSSEGHPNVKISATEDGGGMVVGGSAHDNYVQILARGASPVVKLSEGGREPRVITP